MMTIMTPITENETGTDKPAVLPRPAVGAGKVHFEPGLPGRLPSAIRVLDAISAVDQKYSIAAVTNMSQIRWTQHIDVINKPLAHIAERLERRDRSSIRIDSVRLNVLPIWFWFRWYYR
jgi:hypothetical protein